MTAIGIDLKFSTKTVEWDGEILLMRDFQTEHPSRKEIRATLQAIVEPKATQQMTDRAMKILDSTYEKADLDEVVSKATHLNTGEKKLLHKLLKKYEDLFDGSVGT